ncbi:MAG: CAAX amino terminal protease self- immunity [Firmicutes bacterium ADurb.Bin419]|nr:MAG: CAAX amino terminal protease self- immunity [Firmicutes bacterium ADurb.Bin419]
MKKELRHVIIFFVGTFLWTWGFFFSIVALKLNPFQGRGLILFLGGGAASSWMGIIMAMSTYDKSRKRDFWRRFYDFRKISPYWFLVTVLIFPLIMLISLNIDVSLGGTPSEMNLLMTLIANPLLLIPSLFLSFLSGPLTEEFGWRGFALDPLLKRFGFAKASVLLGFLWGIWHLPWYFMPQTWHGQMGFKLEGFWCYILGVIGISIITSLVYIKSNRSIMAAMLVHLFSNYSTQLFSGFLGTGYSDRTEMARCLLLFSLGIGICIYVRLFSGVKQQIEVLSPIK